MAAWRSNLLLVAELGFCDFSEIVVATLIESIQSVQSVPVVEVFAGLRRLPDVGLIRLEVAPGLEPVSFRSPVAKLVCDSTSSTLPHPRPPVREIRRRAAN